MSARERRREKSPHLDGAEGLIEQVVQVRRADPQPRPLVVLLQDLHQAGVRQDGPVHQQQHLAVEVHEMPAAARANFA